MYNSDSKPQQFVHFIKRRIQLTVHKFGISVNHRNANQNQFYCQNDSKNLCNQIMYSDLIF